MRITEELWNKKASEFSDFQCDRWTVDYSDNDRTLVYIRSIFKGITGKEVFTVYPHPMIIRGSESEKGESQLSKINYILKVNSFFTRPNFLERYNLSQAFKCIIPVFPHTEFLSKAVMEGRKLEESDISYTALNDSIPAFRAVVSNREGNGLTFQREALGYKTAPIYLFGDDILMLLSNISVGYIPSLILYTSDSAFLVTQIFNDFQEYMKEYTQAPKKESTYKIKIGGPSRFGGGIEFTPYDINLDQDINPGKHYNIDLPQTQIDQFIESKEGGIGIFYGAPGCGKSSYIKYLAKIHKNKEFHIMSQDLLMSGLNGFRNHLLNSDKGGGTSIYIIEDCEKLLISRERNLGDTSVISELLNLSDGIFGDYLKVKFILTFNAGVPEIDPAILRKGRLKIKYEFKPLSGERLENLANELGIELNEVEKKSGVSLADLYNHDQKVDYTQEERRKLGF